jgi:hypothetical protein
VRKIARWSAYLRYADSDRAETRADELADVIDDRPGKLFKLITALCFAGAAISTWIVRAATRATADVSRLSITPAGQVTLRKAIAASALITAAVFAVVLVTLAYAQPPANTIGFSLSAASGGSARGSATGTATPRQTIDGWSIQLTVQGLKDSNTNDHRLTAGR